MRQQPLVGQGVLIIEATLSHSKTLHSVGLFSTSVKPLLRDLSLTTHSIWKRKPSILPAEFEPPVPASEWPQIHTLDRATSKTGHLILPQIYLRNSENEKLEEGTS